MFSPSVLPISLAVCTISDLLDDFYPHCYLSNPTNMVLFSTETLLLSEIGLTWHQGNVGDVLLLCTVCLIWQLFIGWVNELINKDRVINPNVSFFFNYGFSIVTYPTSAVASGVTWCGCICRWQHQVAISEGQISLGIYDLGEADKRCRAEPSFFSPL